MIPLLISDFQISRFSFAKGIVTLWFIFWYRTNSAEWSCFPVCIRHV